MSDSKITYMNEISNRIFSELANVKNFLKVSHDLLDMKFLYVYSKKTKKLKKVSSLNSISIQKNLKQGYSLRQISEMSVIDLSQKIFVFDHQLAGGLASIDSITSQQINKIIRNLQSFMGMDSNSIPTFKFFSIKKSTLKDQQVLLCFNNISQKIMIETSSAETELLSLINSTFSHELRNPLNSVIN